MKPSIEEILEKLAALKATGKSKRHWILLSELAEQLDTHIDNIMPGLLLLQREQCLQFNSGAQRLAVNMLKEEGFTSEIIAAPNGFYRVSAMICSDYNTALSKKDSISKKFPGTWVSRKR